MEPKSHYVLPIKKSLSDVGDCHSAIGKVGDPKNSINLIWPQKMDNRVKIPRAIIRDDITDLHLCEWS